ncbi:MAG: hypothetical protein EU541_05140 [Promethearchaeota archaeon]|nr:MAG: hypothetical protein EU541_05140 [Candidatus Lokiarchaeota archaeon]
MTERLYQPDFSCIFSKQFSNAFLYDRIDSLVWPVFEGVPKSEKLENLLSLKDHHGHQIFYRRKINLNDYKVELNCSNLGLAFLQAMDLGREYGISNQDLINLIEKAPKLFKAIVSFDLSSKNENDKSIDTLKNLQEQIDVVGVALYPSYTGLDLNKSDNKELANLLNYMSENNLFLKLDIGNSNFPEYHHNSISKEILHSFLSNHPENIVILSGLDVSGDFKFYYQLLKYFNNLWLELEPRAIGGMPPTAYFQELFNIQGFIQNAWHRILIGSATPTLESSQMNRGLLEATEDLSFSQKCLLRTWGFRNANRIKPELFKPSNLEDLNTFTTIQNIDQQKIIETQNEINIDYKVKLRSYSITQLIFLTDLVKEILKRTIDKFPQYNNGELFFRSYHTTTSLIVNEHEIGNYLDFHYKFAELSKQDSSSYFHTVSALENRADFNRFDHDLASFNGRRQITLPILDGRLEIGGRENFYILVTFGPRTFNIHFKIKLIKT